MQLQHDRIILEDGDEVIYSARAGNNADLVRDCSLMHIRPGMTVADVTFGKGVFWRNVDTSAFKFLPSDLEQNPRLRHPPAGYTAGVDFTSLPYADNSIDRLFIDPPYMHGGEGIADDLNGCYNNKDKKPHGGVKGLYRAGLKEAHRVLRKGGLVFVKCQDDPCGGKQIWMCHEIAVMFSELGFVPHDKFILVQTVKPQMRYRFQKTARKNHSELLIGKKMK